MAESDGVAKGVTISVITAIVLGILTLLWNWLSVGGLIHLLGGVTKADIAAQAPAPAPNNINFGLLDQQYSNQPSWAQITGSEKAIFCALTRVDDDSSKGSCEIGRDGGNHWVIRTGGNSGENACTVTCMLAE
jgi:hypothetical protein